MNESRLKCLFFSIGFFCLVFFLYLYFGDACMKNCYLLKIAICAIFLWICMLVICILFCPCTDFKSSEISCRKFRCNDFILESLCSAFCFLWFYIVNLIYSFFCTADRMCVNTDVAANHRFNYCHFILREKSKF